MPKPQGAIVPESGDYGVYLTYTLRPRAAREALRRACAALPALTKEAARESGEKSLVSAIAIGARAWPRIFGPAKPRELAPFKTIGTGKRIAPATPADLFVHITSNRQDANFILARRVADAFHDVARMVEEVHGFRYLGGKDLTGFIDGTENPKGAEIPKAALVGAEDPAFAGGSYVSIQRYIHNLKLWDKQSLAAQEATIGRTKKHDIEIDDAKKPPTAHIARVVIEEDGEELQILRRSLPYGTATQAGLYFIAYGRNAHNFRRMLTNMMVHDSHGHHDHLMDFVHAVTGASFFAPSLDFLARIG
jgi:putative iron-dependent peroxidase